MTQDCLRQADDGHYALAHSPARGVAARRTILFCANTAWSMYRFRRGLLATLIRDGFEVHIVVPEDPDGEVLRGKGCSVHTMGMSA